MPLSDEVTNLRRALRAAELAMEHVCAVLNSGRAEVALSRLMIAKANAEAELKSSIRRTFRGTEQ